MSKEKHSVMHVAVVECRRNTVKRNKGFYNDFSFLPVKGEINNMKGTL